MSVISTTPGLSANVSILSDKEKELSEMLLNCGQEKLFADWAPSPTDDDKKHAFFEQVNYYECRASIFCADKVIHIGGCRLVTSTRITLEEFQHTSRKLKSFSKTPRTA